MTAATPPFVHLHLHTEFSLADGTVRIKPLAAKCAEFGQPAVAITDLANFYGVVKFYKACMAQGVKPIIGCDVWCESPLHPEQFDRMTLLCQNNDGYHNLCKLLTDAYRRRSGNNRIVIPFAELTAHHGGLICLLDDIEGPLTREDSDETATLERYVALFTGSLYLAVSRIGHNFEQDYIGHALLLANELGIGLVATNRVVYIEASDYEAHEIRVCINEGRALADSRRRRTFTNQQYLKSSTEMAALFSDLPAALANSVEIARRCNVFLNFDEGHLPDFPETCGLSEGELLRRDAEAGLARRLGVASLVDENGNPQVEQRYIERLDTELGVIVQMGFPGYFLIVADFIDWARKNDVPVGPGRGSGAGSLVAWATGITELNPLLYDLIFERFLNPERVSLPDFDIDFCVDGRDRVIEYVADRYGQEQVAQIITFGTMAAKAVVRDVGRVMSLPYGFVDQIAKLIPFELGMTLEKALVQEKMLKERYDQEADVQQLIDSALQLEGIARNVGKHAGGVVIAPKALSEYTPLYAESALSAPVTQLDKDDLEAIGLVKFDFLGLRTLTIIDSAVKMINEQRRREGEAMLDIETIPLDDKETYKFISKGSTTAIFQLESRGMTELVVRVQPEVFEDIVALIALFRPGPLQSGMVEDFVERKAGRVAVKYLHPELEPILNTTYGVILYQEQVMKIAQVLAGYTLGGADVLRKAMGKKLPAEMKKQRDTFLSGCAARGVEKKIAVSIFDLMEKFAGYGFNKSHSAAYALVSYRTAWLKTHYPAAFMAATLSSDMDKTDKVVTFLADCKKMNLEVSRPQINAGFHTFRPLGAEQISYGMGAVKGVGRAAIESIVEEREANGPYHDLFDFCRRLDPSKSNKRVLEALIKSGALDELGANRASLMNGIAAAVNTADQQRHNELVGQGDMFGVRNEQVTARKLTVVDGWDEEFQLRAEKEVLGLYLSGHPYNQYRTELNAISHHDAPLRDLTNPFNGIFSGILMTIRVMRTRRGKIAFLVLDNAEHRVEVSLLADKFSECQSKLQKDRVLIAVGEMCADEYNGGCQMRAEQVFTVDELRDKYLARLHLILSEAQLNANKVGMLKSLLHPHLGGRVTIRINYTRHNGATGVLELGSNWSVTVNDQLIQALGDAYGEENLRLHYNQEGLTAYYPSKASSARRQRAESSREWAPSVYY